MPFARTVVVWLTSFMLICSCRVGVAAECAAADAEFVGHYYLSGVTEVGSELLLRSDGGFQYMLTYGAVDESAQGCWQRRSDRLVLTVADRLTPQGAAPFHELTMRIVEPGRFLRDVGVDGELEYRRQQ